MILQTRFTIARETLLHYPEEIIERMKRDAGAKLGVEIQSVLPFREEDNPAIHGRDYEFKIHVHSDETIRKLLRLTNKIQDSELRKDFLDLLSGL